MMPGAQEVRYIFLEKGLKNYAQMLQDRPNDEDVIGQIARAYLELSKLSSETGETERAKSELEKEIDTRRELVNSFPDNTTRRDLGDALYELGMVFWRENNYNKALNPLSESLRYTKLY